MAKMYAIIKTLIKEEYKIYLKLLNEYKGENIV